MRFLASAVAMFLLVSSSSTPLAGAPDVLGRVKNERARDTSMPELRSVTDGFQAASARDLKRYCASLRKERGLLEQEFADRVRASREAEGSEPRSQAVGRPAGRPLSENMAAKNALAETMVRRTVLACQLFAVREIQTGRGRKNVPRTRDLLARCLDRKSAPDLKDIACEAEDDEPAKTATERKTSGSQSPNGDRSPERAR